MCKDIDDDEGLDKIYDTLENLFQERKFEEVNSILERLDIHSNISVDELIEYLTATLPGSDYLSYRKTFYRNVEKEFLSRSWDKEELKGNTVKQYVEELLQGLQG